AAVLCAGPAQGASGDLDVTFGAGGKVLTDVGAVDWASDVAVQGDGKIVAVGQADGDGVNTGKFALVRYDRNGSPDATFGTAGVVLTSFGGSYNVAADAAIQADGKIVVAGKTNAAGRLDFALARYQPNGALDPSFGGGGRVTT